MLQDIADERGIEHAPALRDRPEVFDDLLWVVAAWRELSNSRTMGFSLPNPISFSDILAYVNLKGVMDGDVDYFIRLIQAMDNAYLTALREKSERESKGNKEGKRRG